MTAGVLWRDCETCGKPFVQERRRGRPRVTCSDGCRTARGVHGDVRLCKRASTGTGVVVVVESERHTASDPVGQILADMFGGEYDDQSGSASYGFVDVDFQRRLTARNLRDIDKVYGLDPADFEGYTVPGVTVIGSDLPWDWERRLEDAHATVPDAA